MDSTGFSHSGWDRVANLAEYLVTLRGLSLSGTQVKDLVQLYDQLEEFDKQRTTFSPRFKEVLTKGRFKARRKSTVTPGVQSTQR